MLQLCYNSDMEEEKTVKKRGPLPGPERSRTTVYLEPELVEWAKRHPLGLSELVRRLVAEEKRKEDGTK